MVPLDADTGGSDPNVCTTDLSRVHLSTGGDGVGLIPFNADLYRVDPGRSRSLSEESRHQFVIVGLGGTALDVSRRGLSGTGALTGATTGYVVALSIAFAIDHEETGRIQWPYHPLVALIGVLPGAAIGSGGSVGKGALIGLAAGLAAVPLVFYPVYCGRSQDSCLEEHGHGVEFLTASTISLTAGMFFGPIAGAAFGSDIWESVPLKHVSVNVRPLGHDTIAFQLGLRF